MLGTQFIRAWMWDSMFWEHKGYQLDWIRGCVREEPRETGTDVKWGHDLEMDCCQRCLSKNKTKCELHFQKAKAILCRMNEEEILKTGKF